jgi:thiol-disulfide isomerase/thioredoxin
VRYWVQTIILLLALGLLGAVLIEAGRPPPVLPPDGAQLLAPQALAGPAPALALADRSGARHTLDALRGRWLLVNFWATWCAPCRDELPHLAALAESLAGEPLVLVLVSVDESWQPIAAMAAELERAAPASDMPRAWRAAAALLRAGPGPVLHLLDPAGSTAARWGSSKFPETYLVDPRGRLVEKYIGPKPWGLDPAIDYLRRRIAGQLEPAGEDGRGP